MVHKLWWENGLGLGKLTKVAIELICVSWSNSPSFTSHITDDFFACIETHSLEPVMISKLLMMTPTSNKGLEVTCHRLDYT